MSRTNKTEIGPAFKSPNRRFSRRVHSFIKFDMYICIYVLNGARCLSNTRTIPTQVPTASLEFSTKISRKNKTKNMSNCPAHIMSVSRSCYVHVVLVKYPLSSLSAYTTRACGTGRVPTIRP